MCTQVRPVVAVHAQQLVDGHQQQYLAGLQPDVYSCCVTHHLDGCDAEICAKSWRPQGRDSVKASVFRTT